MTGETMLIVDDDPMNCAILAELFKDEYTVLEVSSGREAMETLEACQSYINIVLLDIIMTGMTGIDVLEKRKSLDYFKQIPVVMISSSESIEDQIRAFQNGANDYITKPFIPEIVKSRVRNVMSSYKRMNKIIQERENYRFKAELDQMTKLYNKVTAETLAADVLLSRCGDMHAMLIIDIDNFKHVNDTEGHLVGDHTIKIIADEIASRFRQSDIIGRIGGDEYMVLMTSVPNREIARRKAFDLAHMLQYKPNVSIPANVSVSIGLAFSDRKVIDYETLFKHADEALYLAKTNGRGRFEEYGVCSAPEDETAGVNLLIISPHRDVCGMVSTIASCHRRVLERVRVEDAELLAAQLEQGKALVLLDVSGEKDDGAELWLQVRQSNALSKHPVLAVCREGSMRQYALAIENKAVDMVTTPIAAGVLQRRVDVIFSQMGDEIHA